MKIQVKVKPNSKTEEVSREGDDFVVKVREPPGKAKLIRQSSHYWQST